MNSNNLILIASGLLFTIGAQSLMALPQGQYLIHDSEPVKNSNTSKKDTKKNISKPVTIRTNNTKENKQNQTSQVNSLTKKMDALSKTMQSISDELRVQEISNKTIGGDITPTALNANSKSHFYVGVGIDYSFMGLKDKVTAPKRTLQWKEQKVDYYSLVSTVFSFVKRDNDGNIMYDSNGYPQYEMRENPMTDPEIQACYENIQTFADGSFTGDLRAGKEAEVKVLLKKKVDSLIGNSEDSNYQNSLMMVTFGAGGTGANSEKHFRYANTLVGDNDYGNANEGNFYFGEAPTANDKLTYEDGVNQLGNLKWTNLIFTDYEHGANVGQHVTFTQVLGSVVEQTFEGQSTITEAGQKGMYTNLYSQRYRSNGSDAFEKTVELSEISEHIKTHKPVFGGHIFTGWGDKSGRIYYGLEFEVGYSGAKSNVTRNNKVCVNQKDFANGNLQYVDKKAIINNPVTGKAFSDGKVYDESTGKVRPTHISGLGRQTATPELELPDFSQAYDLDVKKTISFGITPMIGFAHMNTVYYASLGVTYSRYSATIKPNMEVLNAYADAIPVGYMKGYMENLNGSTFLHKYVKRSNGKGEFVTADNNNGQENSSTNYKMEAIYPSSIIEQNSAKEENTFSGLRLNYPHYDDGGISVVGENDSLTHPNRPWLDETLLSTALHTQKIKKFRFGFEPGIGFKTFINTKYFIDVRYSCQFSQKLKINHNAFAAYPAHFGRSGLNHNIQITGHKIKLSFGRII